MNTIKIHKSQAEFFILNLLHLLRRGWGYEDVRESVHERFRGGGYEAHTQEWLEEYFDRPPAHIEIEEIIKELMLLVSAEDSPGCDGELVEAVSTLLMDMNGRNSLASHTLNALRQALLLPHERREVMRRIREKEHRCGKCDHTFSNGEAVTFKQEINGERVIEVVYLCATCAPPSSIACVQSPDCEPIQLGEVLKKIVSSCPNHSIGKKLAKLEVNEPEGGETPGRNLDAMRFFVGHGLDLPIQMTPPPPLPDNPAREHLRNLARDQQARDRGLEQMLRPRRNR